MQKKNKYWTQVVQEIAQAQYSHSDLMMAKLTLAYKQSLDSLDKSLSELYLRILKDGEVSSLSLYKDDRYINIYNAIGKELNVLGNTERDVMIDGLGHAYQKTFAATQSAMNITVSLLPKSQIEKVVAMNWKGRNFSDSIWLEKKKLFTLLDKQIKETVILGKSKDSAVKVLKERMGVSFSNADRLVRTETMFIINQGQKDVYVDAGYSQYQIMAALDERTSDICEIEDGNIYNFCDASEGDNYPPFHPNCRTTVIPVLD